MIRSATSIQYACSYAGCSAPNPVDQKVIQCAHCSLAAYCTQECQRADWPNHRALCIAEVKSQIIQSMRAMLQKNMAASSYASGIPLICNPCYIALKSKDSGYFRREKEMLQSENLTYSQLLGKLDYLLEFPDTRQWAVDKQTLFRSLVRTNDSCIWLCDDKITEYEGSAGESSSC